VLVLAAPSRYAVRLELTAGPADVSVDVDVNGRRERVALSAERTSGIEIGQVGPLEPLALTLTVAGGFPARVLREGDSRTLGVWAAFVTTPLGSPD
jgi:hypothetical protein